MRRRLFNCLAALSLLLCVAACVAWVRSYRFSERVSWQHADGSRSVRTAMGNIEVSLLVADWSGHPEQFHGPRYERDEARGPFNWLVFLSGSIDDTHGSWEWGGFAWHERRNARRGLLYGVGVVPLWSIAAATGAMPVWWAVTCGRRRIWGRSEVGRCRACGYDLRATPERCPECGGGGAGRKWLSIPCVMPPYHLCPG